jgi:hypothetical protein
VIAEVRAELLDAWARWDERPGLPETAERYTAAVQSAWPDSETLARELHAAFRRAGWSYEDAVDGAERAMTPGEAR